ncbi:hypothetical protein [Methanosarcina sp.]|uniref:hypothetical protein n=1 Tax=Methanosarcina sp. TaxID=2213 RepID=UPI003C78B970
MSERSERKGRRTPEAQFGRGAIRCVLPRRDSGCRTAILPERAPSSEAEFGS